MKLAGVVTAVVLAHENISPWQVLWWVLCGVLILVGSVLAWQKAVEWWQRSTRPQWDVPVLTVIASGVGLLVWGLVAGFASVPLVG
jgi:tryptophan-rich sensory protein